MIKMNMDVISQINSFNSFIEDNKEVVFIKRSVLRGDLDR